MLTKIIRVQAVKLDVVLLPLSHLSALQDPNTELRALLDRLASQSGRWTIARESTAVRSLEPFQPEQTVSIYRNSKGQYRVEVTGYWGDARMWVCDGKTLMVDPLSQYESVLLRRPMAYDDFAPQFFKPEAYAGSFMAQCLRKGAFEAVVDSTVPVTRSRASTLRFKSRANGFVEITHTAEGVNSIVYDNKPTLQAAYRFNPLWNGPVKDPLTQEIVTYEPRPSVGRDYLSTLVPKGLPVIDERGQ